MARDKNKRKAKVKAKNRQKLQNQTALSFVRIDSQKIIDTFPDLVESIKYVNALMEI